MADSGSHGSFRPFCVLSYKLNHSVGGFLPFGYHLVNVILHGVATALVLKLGRHLMRPSMTTTTTTTMAGTSAATTTTSTTTTGWGPGVAAALFAAHPIHTEAVASVVGRADLFACTFYLATMLVYRRHMELRQQHNNGRQWITLAVAAFLAVLAVLSKETAISVLPVCALFDVLCGVCGSRDKVSQSEEALQLTLVTISTN